ncbi:TetR/AcrR family transcriptional regulator [Streptomyces sp. NPDC006430]|uniref:TetR/AcrR family transcriptional regulator n=1 Tax=Streptomyces sp. NPDC006430 TaxID=3154299 RepID=UPI0033B405C5
MQVIATRAGISRATLVRHFPTRQHLLQAMAHMILDGCDQALTRAETATTAVDQILAALVADFRPFAQLRNLVYVEPDVLGVPEASVRAETIFNRTVQLIQRGQHTGLLRKDMPATWLASTFCGLTETAWNSPSKVTWVPGRPPTSSPPSCCTAQPADRNSQVVTAPRSAGHSPTAQTGTRPPRLAREPPRTGSDRPTRIRGHPHHPGR